jgi:hypothetical protein
MSQEANQLKSVAKQLAVLSKKVEKLSVQVNKVAAAKKAAPKAKKTASKKARPAAAKKTSEDKGTTVLNSVYDVIKKSRKGISISQLKQKTDLNPRQLSNALYKLTKKGSIKSMSRGVYTKA